MVVQLVVLLLSGPWFYLEYFDSSLNVIQVSISFWNLVSAYKRSIFIVAVNEIIFIQLHFWNDSKGMNYYKLYFAYSLLLWIYCLLLLELQNLHMSNLVHSDCRPCTFLKREVSLQRRLTLTINITILVLSGVQVQQFI